MSGAGQHANSCAGPSALELGLAFAAQLLTRDLLQFRWLLLPLRLPRLGCHLDTTIAPVCRGLCSNLFTKRDSWVKLPPFHSENGKVSIPSKACTMAGLLPGPTLPTLTSPLIPTGLHASQLSQECLWFFVCFYFVCKVFVIVQLQLFSPPSLLLSPAPSNPPLPKTIPSPLSLYKGPLYLFPFFAPLSPSPAHLVPAGVLI